MSAICPQCRAEYRALLGHVCARRPAAVAHPITPALTKEEWAAKREKSDDCWIEDGQLTINSSGGGEPYVASNPHALAALALHGQPFGFDREDVKMLREAAGRVRAEDDDFEAAYHVTPSSFSASDFDSLADRIEALLPPEGP